MLIVERPPPGYVTAKVGNPPVVAVHLTELLTLSFSGRYGRGLVGVRHASPLDRGSLRPTRSRTAL